MGLWLLGSRRFIDRLLSSSRYTEEKTEQILKTDPETASLNGGPRILWSCSANSYQLDYKKQLEDLSPDQTYLVRS